MILFHGLNTFKLTQLRIAKVNAPGKVEETMNIPSSSLIVLL